MQSCRYTFSGYDVPGKTAKVNFFENQAPLQSSELSQVFTNKLEQKVIQETPLKLVRNDGDLEFGGAIIGYALRPAAVSGEDQTERTELRITVHVDYINSLEPNENFSENFSATETFNANDDFSSVETRLIESISDQLVQTIFNRAFIDW